MKVKLVGKPADCSYLTPGRIYEVLPTEEDQRVRIIDDQGEAIQISVNGTYPCPHVKPARWERQE